MVVGEFLSLRPALISVNSRIRLPVIQLFNFPSIISPGIMLIIDESLDLETSTGPMRVRVFRPKDESRRWSGIVFFAGALHRTHSGFLISPLFSPVHEEFSRLPFFLPQLPLCYSSESAEIFATTGPIARAAATLACHGFVVAVPEFFHEWIAAGTALTYTPEDTAKGNSYKVRRALWPVPRFFLVRIVEWRCVAAAHKPYPSFPLTLHRWKKPWLRTTQTRL